MLFVVLPITVMDRDVQGRRNSALGAVIGMMHSMGVQFPLDVEDGKSEH